MEKTKTIINTGVKVLKFVGSAVITLALVESGFQGGKMLADDIEVTADAINKKINPTVMKKRHWYSKPEEYNTRTNQFVADKKKVKN